MRAVVLDRFGPPTGLRSAELPVPHPGQDEVLVQVRAVGVNAIDWKTRAGRGVAVPNFPAVLGWDVSGVVVAVGSGVTRFRGGEEVFGTLRFPRLASAYAEYVTAPQDELAVKPATVDYRNAAGAMVCLTAWQSVFDHGGVVAGQRVLVHGAAGGVGHIAVQLAHAADAEVIATASARNHDFLTGLGARQLIDYTTQRIEDAAAGVDVVIDTRGGVDFVRLLEVLRPGGIIVSILGQQPGQLETVTARGLRAAYTYVGPDGRCLDEIARWMTGGAVRVHVERSFPLEDAASAHAVGDRGHVRGLLVLDVADQEEA